MTTIRETIARAILDGMARFRGDPYIDDSGGLGGVMIDGLCDLHEAADAVLCALDEAGCVVVPRDASPAMTLEGARSIGRTMPIANHTERAADVYRAMIAAAVVE